MARTKGTYILPANIEKADLLASGQFPYSYIGMEV